MFNWQNKKRALIGSMAGLAIAAGAVWGLSNSHIVNAQAAPTLSNSAQMVNVDQEWFGGEFGEWDEGYGSYIDEDKMLANALGITDKELETAFESAYAKAIEQAAADGNITEEEATQLQQHPEFGFYIMESMVSEEAFDGLLAEALGLTAEELQAAEDGAIDKAVESGLITQAQANDMKLEVLIEEKMEQAFEDALSEGVSQGLITQAQADNMLSEEGGFGGPMFFEEEFFFGGPGGFYEEEWGFGGPSGCHEEFGEFDEEEHFHNDDNGDDASEEPADAGAALQNNL